MMSKYLTLVVLLTALGCEDKQYKKSENSSVDIVSELNKGDADSVIQKIENKKNPTSREKYYLASALSIKGGIDVYSLYPILEIQLFRKNSLEWSGLSKDKNPYLKFLKSQEGTDFEKRRKLREARWEKNKARIISRLGLSNDLPNLETLRSEHHSYTVEQEEFDRVNTQCKRKYESILETKTQEDFFNQEELFSNYINHEVQWPYSKICYHYIDSLVLESRRREFLQLYNDNLYMGSPGWEMAYMNILWNTYEAIPMMKQMPTLNDDQQSYITESLEIYKDIISDPEFKDVSLKNMTVLTGVSLLSIYKESFNLDEISSIQDLFCTYEPRVMTDNYELIRKRLLFLAELKEFQDQTKDFNKFQKHIDAFKSEVPEQATEEEKENFIRGAEEAKMSHCFNA